MLELGVQWMGEAPACVAQCMAERLIESEVCGAGVAPVGGDVGAVVGEGYVQCCQQCGGAVVGGVCACDGSVGEGGECLQRRR